MISSINSQGSLKSTTAKCCKLVKKEAEELRRENEELKVELWPGVEPVVGSGYAVLGGNVTE